MARTVKQNWFETLVEALDAEGLLDSWDGMTMSPIQYGETRHWYWEKECGEVRACSIYRSDSGRYERPLHYRSN